MAVDAQRRRLRRRRRRRRRRLIQIILGMVQNKLVLIPSVPTWNS